MKNTSVGGFADWQRDFEGEQERRRTEADPDWEQRVRLPRPVAKSLQKFQVGEDGDGSNLIGKADEAGDVVYSATVRLFIAEERNHARLLKCLLTAGGVPTLAGHWSDRAFVRIRRLMGLRLELLVLMIAEVVALRYYRALAEGAGDALTRRVAARILADEERHVPFHCKRLRDSVGELPVRFRPLVMTGWKALLFGAAVFVSFDHGPALRQVKVGRTEFIADVRKLGRGFVADILGTHSLEPTLFQLEATG